MSNGVGEWIETRLSQVIESYPEYKNYNLFVWDSDQVDSELFDLGNLQDVYDQYKNCYVFLTDEDMESVWLEGTLEDLEV